MGGSESFGDASSLCVRERDGTPLLSTSLLAKTHTGLSVEEKIQLAMAQGDFDNLKGKGEPLARYNGGGGSEGPSHACCSSLLPACWFGR